MVWQPESTWRRNVKHVSLVEGTTTETQKMCLRYFCPAKYITKTKSKTNQKTNPKRKPEGLDLGLCTSLLRRLS